jgi:uncharacterized membrane protein YdbT with pleckstrin-like domain
MSYVRHVLQPGEKLLVEGKPHWVAYWRALLFFAIAAAAFVASSRLDQGSQFAAMVGAGVLALIGLGFAAHAWFIRWTTEIGVTDRRVIYKSGFISRQTAEMNMDKIETVLVDQSLLGRILDYGTITIQGTGASMESLRHIAGPAALRNAITAR